MMKCGKCHKRLLCSLQCQKADWKLGEHRSFCQKSGEINFDYEIREAPGKGLGVFALRNFKSGEKVMVERAVATFSPDILQVKAVRTARWLVNRLVPVSGSFDDKVKRNCFNYQLYLVMAKVNHECVPNCYFHTMNETRPQALIACKDIKCNEEITTDYLGFDAEKVRDRQSFLQETYGFKCVCLACTDSTVGALFLEAVSLQKQSQALVATRNVEKLFDILEINERLVKVYEGLGVSQLLFVSVYFLMYVLAITKTETVDIALKYLKQAGKWADLFWPGEDLMFGLTNYLADPKSHPNYLKND
jgi:hypothetical protein